MRSLSRTAALCLLISGISVVSASALSGPCTRAGQLRTVKSVKYQCKKTSGRLRWVKTTTSSSATVGGASTTATTTPATTTTTQRAPTDTVVLRTLTNQKRNTTFQIALQEFPEIAQGIVVDAPITFNVLLASLYGLNTVQPEFFRVPFNQKSLYEKATTTFEPFDATVTVSVWRATSGVAAFTDTLDLTSGFTAVHQEAVPVTIKQNPPPNMMAPMSIEMKLSKSIDLAAGAYVIVLGFEWKNYGVLTIRLWGQESGTNTIGGKGGGAVKNCTYTPTQDAYPSGKAWAGLGVRRWNGDADSSIGFGSRFSLATAKVTACIVVGEWGNDIFNPGDLDIALVYRG